MGPIIGMGQTPKIEQHTNVKKIAIVFSACCGKVSLGFKRNANVTNKTIAKIKPMIFTGFDVILGPAGFSSFNFSLLWLNV